MASWSVWLRGWSLSGLKGLWGSHIALFYVAMVMSCFYPNALSTHSVATWHLILSLSFLTQVARCGTSVLFSELIFFWGTPWGLVICLGEKNYLFFVQIWAVNRLRVPWGNVAVVLSDQCRCVFPQVQKEHVMGIVLTPSAVFCGLRNGGLTMQLLPAYCLDMTTRMSWVHEGNRFVTMHFPPNATSSSLGHVENCTASPHWG